MKKILLSLFIFGSLSLFSNDFGMKLDQGQALMQMVGNTYYATAMTYCQENDYKFFKVKNLSYTDKHGNNIVIQGNCLDTSGDLYTDKKDNISFEILCYKNAPKDEDAIDVQKLITLMEIMQKQAQEMKNKVEESYESAYVPTEFVIEIESLKQLKSEIANTDTPVFVDCYGEHCPPCKTLAPTYDKWAEQYSTKAKFLKVDASKVEGLFDEYQIRAFPTLLIFDKNGELKDKKIGLPDIAYFIKKEHGLG